MKLSDYVASRIEEHVSHVFCVSGGGCIHLVDSISKSNTKLIPNLQEQGSAICAESYSQYTNKLGVALVTTGPGATNAVTGIASAWLDSIPVLIISGQVQNKDRVGNRGVRQIGFQEINSVSIYKEITKYAVTVSDPKSIKYHIDKALHLATNGRKGPVLLDIPLDVQAAEINPNKLKGYAAPKSDKFNQLNLFDDEDELFSSNMTGGYVKSLLNSLSEAKRPIVLAGNGIRLSDAYAGFIEFIEKTKIPVLTTWKALDLLEETHPQYVGRPGGVGQRGANFNQQNSDFIIVIGARLDHGQLAYQPQYFAREAVKCIVDVDENEINKLGINIDYPLSVDAKHFFKQINPSLKEKHKAPNKWLKHCKNSYNKYPVVLDGYLEDKELISNYAFIEHLSDLLPENSLLIPGSSGASSEVTMQAFKCKKGTRVYNSQGLGAMGFAIPSAIGGCIASGKETISIDGDGGFTMNVQELELISRYNLPIKIFVLNNNGYGSIRTTQNSHFDGRLVISDPSSGLTLPSVMCVSASYKIPYMKIPNQSNLKADIKTALDTSGPLICELKINPDHVTLPKASVRKKEDGSFTTLPMEDLFPFLDREEFKKNLFITELEY